MEARTGRFSCRLLCPMVGLLLFVSASPLVAGMALEDRGAGQAPPGRGTPFSRFFDHLNILLWRFYDSNHVLEPWDLKGHFTSEPGYTYDLPGTTDMVVLLWSVGELDGRTTPHGREAWARLIRSFQDPKTGLFTRGNRRRLPEAELTARASVALKLLGKTPRYPFRWARGRFADQAAVTAWVEGFDWSDVASGSREMGLAAALTLFPQPTVPTAWHVWLSEALVRRCDPSSGLWRPSLVGKVLGVPTPADLVGASRFWWFLETRGEPLPEPARVVEQVLSLQGANGTWSSRWSMESAPGVADAAALNGLRHAIHQLDRDQRARLETRILAAVDRFAKASVAYLADPERLMHAYTDTHDLTSAVLAVAEMEALHFDLTGRHKFPWSRPWRPALPYLSWM